MAETPNTITVPRLISVQQFCEWTGMQPQTAAVRRMQGKPPAFIKVGRLVRYDAVDVAKWIEENRCENTVQSRKCA